MTAFGKTNILLPKSADMTKWSVVACDQFTSQPEYWQECERFVGGEKSTLDLIFPEVYLDDKYSKNRIKNINRCMQELCDSGFFREYKDSLIYVRRTQSDGRVREGIVGAVDLEEYDYSKGSDSLIRATEATVAERLPARVKIRENAPLELPHIMILIDDEDKSVIEPLAQDTGKLEKLYDFELMQGGGRLEGYLLDGDKADGVLACLDRLADIDAFNKKYGLHEEKPLVFAMGDGNHSLASAKAYYEKLKTENPDKDMSNHPARYALAEIVNLHSPALEFEAIHRIVTGVNAAKLLQRLDEKLGLGDSYNGQKITVVHKGVHTDKYISKPLSKLAVGSLQAALDEILAGTDARIDYIHGKGVVDKLSMKDNSVGFILPDMAKSELFPTVICDGALPRKTFSMGHAEDKRYYCEARKIK